MILFVIRIRADLLRMDALQEASDHQKFSLLQVVTKLPELSNEVAVLNKKWDANTPWWLSSWDDRMIWPRSCQD